MFGPYVVVTSGKHTNVNGSYRFIAEEKALIKICPSTWVDANTTLSGGAVIGSDCAIGCNAAVTRGSIPDNAFAAGVPAVVKSIDNQKEI